MSYYLSGLSWVMERFDEADAFFGQAIELGTRVRAKFFVAQAQLRRGQMLVERRAPGDLSHARPLLDVALAAATDYHYGTVRRRAVGALDQLG